MRALCEVRCELGKVLAATALAPCPYISHTGGASPDTVISGLMRETPANSRYLGRPESRNTRGNSSETEGRILPVGLVV